MSLFMLCVFLFFLCVKHVGKYFWIVTYIETSSDSFIFVLIEGRCYCPVMLLVDSDCSHSILVSLTQLTTHS